MTNESPTDAPPPTWEGLSAALHGLGLLSSQLNDYRLYLPIELRRRLPHLLELPWIVSCWCDGCLRVIPLHLWDAYLVHLKERSVGIADDAWVHEAIIQPACPITMEQGGRWHLPPSLADTSRIGSGCLVLICQCEGGLEIWEAHTKQERLRALVGKLDHKLVAAENHAHAAAFHPADKPAGTSRA